MASDSLGKIVHMSAQRSGFKRLEGDVQPSSELESELRL